MSSSILRSIGLPVATTLFAGAAVAQPPPPPPQGQERMVEVRVEQGGAPEVKVNGQRIAPDRIRPRGDGTFEIVDGPERAMVEVRVENGGTPEVMINGQRIAPDRIRPRGDGTYEIVGGPERAIVEVIEVPRGPQQRMQAPRPMIGVVLAPIDPLLARHLKLDPAKATMVAEVMPGTPAMEAGIVAGDILLEIGGEPASIERIGEVVARKGPDGEVKVWVLHDGEKRAVKLRPRVMTPPMPEPPPQGMRPMPGPGGPGMGFDDRGDRGPQGGDWQDLRGSLDRMRERMGDEVRERLEQWREQWEGPWGEENIRRPLREYREQTRREFERMMQEMERLEQEMRERLEMRWRWMQEAWQRGGGDEQWDRGPRPDDRPQGRGGPPREGQSDRPRPRRNGGDAPRRGDAPPVPSSPA
ncbi:MAG: PDZ domain-containing protein [Phycisphaerales bacterium]|jgi:hypothetical protein